MLGKEVCCFDKKWKIIWQRNGYVGLSDGKNVITVTEQELREECINHELDIESEGGYPFE